ncbi:A/G-specific adenine glycosylase [Methylosoma difficile]
MNPSEFQHQLLAWFDQHGRKTLPWQNPITPYRVWLSETMLQQTQVTTVIPYFNAFVERFPDLASLAQASTDEVLQFWAGLGYYARARNLHKAAQIMAAQGGFPDSIAGLTALPGIGLSTAGAILSIAFNNSQPILDGNVKRVLSRYQAISGWPGSSQTSKQLWALSSQLTPIERVADYTQAIMDLGATVCTRSKPKCPSCPLQNSCQALLLGNVQAYPSPKPAKSQPVKQLIFLMLRNSFNEVLLEKRPPVGIWGSLWSLPEFEDTEAALAWCHSQQIRIGKHRLLATKRHTFSHFHLDFTPLLVEIENLTDNVMEAKQTLWYNIGLGNGVALAAPITQLLQQLHNEEDND